MMSDWVGLNLNPNKSLIAALRMNVMRRNDDAIGTNAGHLILFK